MNDILEKRREFIIEKLDNKKYKLIDGDNLKLIIDFIENDQYLKNKYKYVIDIKRNNLKKFEEYKRVNNLNDIDLRWLSKIELKDIVKALNNDDLNNLINDLFMYKQSLKSIKEYNKTVEKIESNIYISLKRLEYQHVYDHVLIEAILNLDVILLYRKEKLYDIQDPNNFNLSNEDFKKILRDIKINTPSYNDYYNSLLRYKASSNKDDYVTITDYHLYKEKEIIYKNDKILYNITPEDRERVFKRVSFD